MFKNISLIKCKTKLKNIAKLMFNFDLILYFKNSKAIN